MNKPIWVKIPVVLIVLVLIFTTSYWVVPVAASHSNTGISGTKISSLLSAHIQMKQSQAAKFDQSKMAIFGTEPNSTGETTSANTERVFLHFNQQPTAAQVNELNSLGITVYPDSWIPPITDFKTGFVLAELPIDQLNSLASKSYIMMLDTAEQFSSPQNDRARSAMNVERVWNEGYTGAGVTVAVLDSGLDTSNPDFPTPIAAMDYSYFPNTDSMIANTVTGHGTHVTGSLLGRGLYGATYKGVAPESDLVFIKVGNDIDAKASSAAIIYAIRDAVIKYHVKIINLSYGGWSEFHDGSDQVCQVIDYVTSKGATVFTAAGNEALMNWHYSGNVDANNTTSDIQLTVAEDSTTYLATNLVWYDGNAHNSLSLQVYDHNHKLLVSSSGGQSESSRGTESNFYSFDTALKAGTYYFKVRNASSNNQLFHLYYMGGSTSVTFSNADVNYSIDSPAEADSAISVGAYVTREYWTNYQGKTYSFYPNESTGTMASFSSHGPRVDKQTLVKPNIFAPGSAIISDRDPLYQLGNKNYDPGIIANNGQQMNASVPANYFVMEGTSTASPMAAGVAALLLQKTPTLTPAQVRHALESTANNHPGMQILDGWGLINAQDAINKINSVDSYSDAELSISCNEFNSGTDLIENQVYLGGTGFLYNHKYRLSCYDGAGSLVTSETTISRGNQFYGAITLNPGVGVAGVWQAVISEPEFTPPDTLDPTWAHTIVVSDNFIVQHLPPGSPTVITISASDIDGADAILSGTLVNIGDVSSVDVFFEYGTDMNYSNRSQILSKNSTGEFSIKVTDLIFGQIYHFRAVADGGDGKICFGEDAQFIVPMSISHLSGKIAFSSDGSIFVMNCDGSHKVALTDGISDWGPEWSPDGSKIAFMRGDTQIYVMNEDGNNLSLVRSAAFRDGKASWSPDSSKLIFAEYIHNERKAICTVNIDGSGWKELASGYPWGYSQPDWSPDGSKIAFVGCYAPGGIGGFQVFTMNADATNIELITNTSNSQYLKPAWSPDGTKIAYVSGSSIRVVNFDGSNNVQLTTNPLIAYNYNPAWSPDGNEIICAANIKGTNTNQIYVMNVNSSIGTFITEGYSDNYPSWNYDILSLPKVKTKQATVVTSNSTRLNCILQDMGESSSVKISFQWGTNPHDYSHETPVQVVTRTGSFYFDLNLLNPGTYYYRAKAVGNGIDYGDEYNVIISSYSGLSGEIAFASTRDGNSEIYIMNADGSNQKRLTNNNAKDSYPVFSPDGHKIAFTSDRDGGAGIYIMGSDGENPTKIAQAVSTNYQLAWAPDGSKIAFTDSAGQIFTIDTNGSNKRQITYTSRWGSQNPTWSPDGSKIAFESIDAVSGCQQIFVVNLDGSDQHCLTSIMNSHCYLPSWSPDGSQIAYQKMWTGGCQLQTIYPDGTHTQAIYNGLSPIYSITWSPDSNNIAFTSNYDICVINVDGTNLIDLSPDNSMDICPSWTAGTRKKPAVTTDSSIVSSNSAVINGKLSNCGTSGSAAVSFNWCSDDNSEGGNIIGIPAVLTDEGTFSAQLNGLTPGRTYHYKAKAIGDATAYGDEMRFNISPVKIALTSVPQNIIAGQASEQIDIQIRDEFDIPMDVMDDTPISLTSTSSNGSFSLSKDDWVSISSVTIPAGNNSASFYYRDTKAGITTITAARTNYFSDSQEEIISPGNAAQVIIVTKSDGTGKEVLDQSITTGVSLTVYAVMCDQYGNFISSANCTWLLTDKTKGVTDTNLMSAEDGQSALFSSDLIGTATIQATCGSWTSHSGKITVVAGPAVNLNLETSYSGSGTVIGDWTLRAGEALTVYSIARDAYSNFVSNVPVNWSLNDETGSVVDSDLIPATNNKSAILVAHKSGSGVIQASIAGFQNTNSGIIQITKGVASKVRTETMADGSGVLISNQYFAPGDFITAYAITRDVFNNYIGNAPASWSLTNKTKGVTDTDLIPSEDGLSATFTGNLGGSAKIQARISGLNSIDSGTITVDTGLAIKGKVGIETKADGTGTAVSKMSMLVGDTLIVYAIARDEDSNFIANLAASWSLIDKTGSVTDKDLKTAKDSKSAVLTGHKVGSGVIHAAVNGMYSIDSGVIAVTSRVVISTTSLAKGESGTAYSQILTAKYGEPPYFWSIISGSLPPGLSLTDNIISGIPSDTQVHTYSFKAKVMDNMGSVAIKTLSIKILTSLSISSDTIPPGEIGLRYKSTSLKAIGGTGKYTWSIRDGTLPGGLALSSRGVIQGKPKSSNAGDYNITVQLSDGISTITKDFTMTIFDPPMVNVLQDGKEGEVYDHVLTASGGSGGYKFTVTGKLPNGLKFNTKNASVYGVPTKAGSYSFKVKIVDSLKGTVTQNMTIVINPVN